MLIEIYKGIQITHDAIKDEFVTSIVLNKNSSGKKEYIRAGRLQKVRDEVDKFLNTAARKPVIPMAFKVDKYDKKFEEVKVICYNAISGDILIETKEGKVDTVRKSYGSYDDKLYINCKENSAIVANLNKKNEEIKKIEKETSCMRGKLIPVKDEHFIK